MNNQLAPILNPLKKIISDHHAFIFIVMTCLLLALAIYSLYDVLTLSTSTTTNVTSTIGNFDQKTIEKIKSLHDSNDAPSTLVFPKPRSNPFVEN